MCNFLKGGAYRAIDSPYGAVSCARRPSIPPEKALSKFSSVCRERERAKESQRERERDIYIYIERDREREIERERERGSKREPRRERERERDVERERCREREREEKMWGQPSRGVSGGSLQSRQGNPPKKPPTQIKTVCTNSLRKLFWLFAACFKG